MAAMVTCEQEGDKEDEAISTLDIQVSMVRAGSCLGAGMHWEAPRSGGVPGLPRVGSQELAGKSSERLQTGC